MDLSNHQAKHLTVLMCDDSQDEFNTALKSNKLVVLEVYAAWAGPARAIQPYYEGYAPSAVSAISLRGRARCLNFGRWSNTCFSESLKYDAVFLEADIDKTSGTNDIVNTVRSVPTFFLYKNGALVYQFAGASPATLDSAIANNV